MVLGLQEPFIFHVVENEAKSCDRGWTISYGILSHVVGVGLLGLSRSFHFGHK